MRLLGCWRFGVCGGGSSLGCNEALKWFKSGVDLQALQTVPGALQGPHKQSGSCFQGQPTLQLAHWL